MSESVTLDMFNRLFIQDHTPDNDRTMAMLLMVNALENISRSLETVAEAIDNQPDYYAPLLALEDIAKAIGRLDPNR